MLFLYSSLPREWFLGRTGLFPFLDFSCPGSAQVCVELMAVECKLCFSQQLDLVAKGCLCPHTGSLWSAQCWPRIWVHCQHLKRHVKSCFQARRSSRPGPDFCAVPIVYSWVPRFKGDVFSLVGHDRHHSLVSVFCLIWIIHSQPAWPF